MTIPAAPRGASEPSGHVAADRAQRARFDEQYRLAETETARAIEREVCGCAYGATSWTTRSEADLIAELLSLAEGVRLLDLGAGAGWPALYWVKTRRCRATLADISGVGVEAADRRAEEDGIADFVDTLVAEASRTGLPGGSFDAITHSDLLCCLPRKREVLAECRRLVLPGGVMAFTVIEVAPGLKDADRARAIENGPEYIATPAAYARLLEETGWRLASATDLTEDYATSCRRQLAADEAHADGCAALLGAEAFTERVQSWRRKADVIECGLIRRALYIARTER